MPRTRRPVDNSPLAHDDLNKLAACVGKFWKHYRRRQWPGELKDTVAALLLDLRFVLAPVAEFGGIANINRTRSDIRGLANFLRGVASRDADTDLRSRSVPAMAKLNKDACEFIP